MCSTTKSTPALCALHALQKHGSLAVFVPHYIKAASLPHHHREALTRSLSDKLPGSKVAHPGDAAGSAHHRVQACRKEAVTHNMHCSGPEPIEWPIEWLTHSSWS